MVSVTRVVPDGEPSTSYLRKMLFRAEGGVELERQI